MKLSTLIITCAVLFLAASAFLYGYIQNNRPSNIVGIDMPIELLELTQQNRLAAFPEPHPNLQKILEGFKTPNLDAETDIQIAERIQQYRRRGSTRPNELTHEQLIYDTEFLFDILRYGYGAYQYFGGDDVFLPLRETTLGRIHRLNNPATAGAYVNSLLVPALESVIADNHFWIDRNRIGIGSQLYMNHDFVVHRTDNGFATELGGTIHLVAETTLDGQQVEGLLPTLTEDGQFAWAFGHVIYGSYAPFGIYMDVIFENAETGEKTAYTVRLVKVSNASGLTSRMYSLSRRNGIPILRNRHLQGNMQHSFTNTGATLRDEPVLILDLRGHNGGNDGLAWEWIRQYTGQAPGHGVMFSSVRRHSLIGNTLAYWMPYS
ncbi:MAG: hypothetical protein FWE92_04820, partial [Defluviitaleaceae bacterium]|nr:hypothetical protein [Defluviitaleaceae bacterium]